MPVEGSDPSWQLPWASTPMSTLLLLLLLSWPLNQVSPGFHGVQAAGKCQVLVECLFPSPSDPAGQWGSNSGAGTISQQGRSLDRAHLPPVQVLETWALLLSVPGPA